MRLGCHRVGDSDVSAVELDAIQLLNASGSILLIAHGDEAEASRSLRSLIVDNDGLLNLTVSRELILEVNVAGADRQTEAAEDVRRGSLGIASRRRGRRAAPPGGTVSVIPSRVRAAATASRIRRPGAGSLSGPVGPLSLVVARCSPRAGLAAVSRRDGRAISRRSSAVAGGRPVAIACAVAHVGCCHVVVCHLALRFYW